MVDKMPKRKHRDSDGKAKRRICGGLGRSRGNIIGETIRAIIVSSGIDGTWRTTLLCGPKWNLKQLCEEACGRYRYSREWWLLRGGTEPTSRWKEIYMEN